MMGKCDSIAIQEWLKKRYSLLFLRINERTDHAFAIVDLPYPPLNPVDQPFDCKISISTPRQAERDFLGMSDFEEATTFFNSKGWEKRLLEISRR